MYASQTGVKVSGEKAAAVRRRPAPVTWPHWEGCAWTAAWLTARGRGMVAPREIVLEDEWRGELRWREHGELRKRGHRPDLAVRLADGQVLPVEVELSAKSRRRFAAVLELHAGWIVEGRSGAVIYVCGDQEIAERVLVDGEQVGLSVERGTLRVELLATIQREAAQACGAATGWHLLGTGAAV